MSAGEIWVNDVPLLNWKGPQTTDGVYNGNIPINQVVLQNGVYELKCILKPHYGQKKLVNTIESSVYTIGFRCRHVDNIKSGINVNGDVYIMERPYQKSSSDYNWKDPLINLEVYVDVTKLTITELPFVLDGWQNSVDLSKIKEKVLFQEVLDYYRQIHAIMAAHNATKFLELSEEKMKLQEQAFYFTEERKKSFRAGAISLFSQKLAPLPLVPSNLKLQIMSYGKLVRLLQLDGSAALQYASSKPAEQSNIELDVKLHMRSQYKGFSII